MKRQLPQIAQRLTVTLEKLQAPTQFSMVQVGATSWWEGLKQRYTRGGIAFKEGSLNSNATVPGELFDSVA